MVHKIVGSTRLALDLQACQTPGSGPRGVGRYSQALFTHVGRHAEQLDVRAVVSTALPIKPDFTELSESHVVRLAGLPAWNTRRQHEGGGQDDLDALAYSAALATWKPDLIHVSHAFEGFSDRVAYPSTAERLPGQVISATLYDLIPMVFRDHYFRDDNFRKWYLSRVAWLKQADLLLSISEASRQDAINYLGIDARRIVTIHGGVSPHFSPAIDREAERVALAHRFGLKGRFVLYTGGDDHRKNIAGAILGYAAVPPDLRRDLQLVIVCAMEGHRRDFYLDIGRAAGLDPADLLITGYVAEGDLLSFYRTCEVFVFPSLYEGLGLPVLEAMSCGAPVIGGDNSSIREIIKRPDALFDAKSPESIGAAITAVVTNQAFDEDLRQYALRRSRDYSWDETARIALSAWDSALDQARHGGIQSAVSGWVGKKRVAVFTPLPPCRSGVADYNADFLPHLARHFEIDIYVDGYRVADEVVEGAFRIFDASEFSAVASNYYAVLYEMGNSEFHAHMLPLLEKFPGIVGLHDAFLSGLIGYTDFHLGNAGNYNRQMLFSHASKARRFLAPVRAHPDPNGVTDAELPCTKAILDLATGVISHSPFNLSVARTFYPEGWSAPYRIIPQMASVANRPPERDVASIRQRLGFAPDDVVVATFGHVIWTKLGDRLLEAFLSSHLGSDRRVCLVFVGEIVSGEFGDKMKRMIRDAQLGRRLKVTGFLPDHEFEDYLWVTDVAIQLRTKSRGGTPKGVLDCLAHGVPVILNNEASYHDYPDDVVFKIDSDPSTESVADALSVLCLDGERRASLSRAGLAYVREQHAPSLCAASYAAAIHDFVARDSATKPDGWIPKFAPHLSTSSTIEKDVDSTLAWLAGIQRPSYDKPRLFIDVTEVAKSEYLSGIQRVVTRITQEMYCSNVAGFEPVAVQLVDGELRVANEWLSRQGLLCPAEKLTNAVEFRAGDILLLLDSTWLPYTQFFPIFQRAREAHVRICTVVYDLLPIRQLEYFTDGKSRVQWFEDWFHAAVVESDALVCISRTVAEDVSSYLEEQMSHVPKPRIGFWHLGSDFSQHQISMELVGEPLRSLPYLLMVGTIEPRKSHELALDAMERLWESGHGLCLCIAGKQGWRVDGLMERLRNHPKLGVTLFLFESPSDQQINALYSGAAGLLFLSKGEGFGLPLVEAANHGIPIVCSDIPVFREIAGSYATYVDNMDPVIVAQELEDWWKRRNAGTLPATIEMPRLSWEESAESLLDLVFHAQQQGWVT